jgi:hypothetical protein
LTCFGGRTPAEVAKYIQICPVVFGDKEATKLAFAQFERKLSFYGDRPFGVLVFESSLDKVFSKQFL